MHFTQDRLNEKVVVDANAGRQTRPTTPHQILGPFFPVALNAAGNLFAAAHGHSGASETIEIKGRILNQYGNAVTCARIIVWQANRFGRYTHPNDLSAAPIEPDFVGHAEIRSGEDGGYRFTTIMPGVYPGARGRLRPPHIHFEVQGQFERLITQMYFPDEPLNASDRALMSASDPDLLIAKAVDQAGKRVFSFDIVLTRG